MIDRELLELAAKACGVNLWWDGDSPKEIVQHWSGNPEDGGETKDYDWNPLEEDGAALRLAVKINEMRMFIYSDEVSMGCLKIVEKYTGDPMSAVRRAIVRAAAEIGKSMP